MKTNSVASTKLLPLLGALSVVAVASDAAANVFHVGEVVSVAAADPRFGFISFASAVTGVEPNDCDQSAFVNRVVVDLSTEFGRAAYSTATAAMLAGHKLLVVYRDKLCSLYSDTIDVWHVEMRK